jgi:hypothetical protein
MPARTTALLTVVLRQLVHVHVDEAVTALGVHAAPEAEGVVECLVAMLEGDVDRLAQQPRDPAHDVVAEIAPGGVHAEGQGQPRLQQPPFPEVEAAFEPMVAIRQLPLVDEHAGLCAPCRDLLLDDVERQHAVCELAAERHLQHEEGRRQRPRHHDLRLAQLVERQRLARDHDRPVPVADRRSVRQERVPLVHERIRRKGHCRHLEPSLQGPFVQGLDVLDHGLEVEALRIDGSRRQAPEHEGVVGICAEADADEHGGGG